MSAAEILKLIEAVDPADSAAMDEIDARVWCWLDKKTYLRHTASSDWGDCYGRPIKTGVFIKEHTETDPARIYVPYTSCQGYTRSRDALKAIRPEGWGIRTYQDESGFYCHLNKWFGDDNILFDRDKMPTEELAELHAIIQAIEYERTSKRQPLPSDGQ